MDLDESLIYWIWLSELKGIGPVTAKTLLNRFETPVNIYRAQRDEIINLPGIGDATAALILNSKSLEMAEVILNKCQKLNIKILRYNDDLYKQEIRDIKNAPVLLYYRGNLIENSLGVGIVGARRCTEYGKRVTLEAAEFLALNNIPVISGMAKGIDGYSHTACLKAGGYTIAVLGCGLDICYPREHDTLMGKIIENGAVVSEYPPGTKPDFKNFPKRNRLISAWCKKLLIVEATEKSGSLITAALAREQNREILAAPSSIYSKEGKGTNKLIENGAKIYLKPDQLLEGFDVQKRDKNIVEKNSLKDLKPLERIILEKIRGGEITLNELILLLNEDRDRVLETVSIMEIEGKIRNFRGVLKEL